MPAPAPLVSCLSRRQATGLVAAAVVSAFAGAAGAAEDHARRRLPTHGFNLPRWVDQTDGVPPSRAVLAKLHRLGFETVRLPVNADLIAATDRATSREALGHIQAAISELLAAGFAVIVDMHPSRDLLALLKSDPQAGGARADAAWRLLSGVIANLPDKSVYTELLNEPPLARPDWLELRARLAATVRSKCPRHTIVWGPSRYQGIWELHGTPPLDDPNQIAAIHYYVPMGFTHQCETWWPSPLQRMRGLPFPATFDTPAVVALADKFRSTGDERALAFLKQEFAAPWSVAHIAAAFAEAGRWAGRNDCPVILDEFGVLNFCVDSASRANWVRAVRVAAQRNGIGWTYWEVDQGFGFIHDRRSTQGFERSMIAALLGT